jgi:hypothetical protein
MKKSTTKPLDPDLKALQLIENDDPRVQVLVQAYLSGLNSERAAKKARIKVQTARTILRTNTRTKDLYSSHAKPPRPLPPVEDDAKCLFAHEVLGKTHKQAAALIGKKGNNIDYIQKRSPEVVKAYSERKLQVAHKYMDALEAMVPDIVNDVKAIIADMGDRKKIKNSSYRDTAAVLERLVNILDYKEPVATDVNVNFEARRDFVAAIDDAVNCDEPMSIEEQEGPYAQKQLQTDQYLDPGDKNDD